MLDMDEQGDQEPEVKEEDFTVQLAALQEMVKDMKDGFTVAMTTLAEIQYGDQMLQEKVENNKQEHDQQLSDVVQMVLSLKTEFSDVLNQLKTAKESQQSLQQQVDYLQLERDILLEELERAGAISEQIRKKYHSGKSRPNGLSTSASTTSLTVLLDRARGSHYGSQVTSDHDSGVTITDHHRDGSSGYGEHTPPTISPMVQSYINNLHNSSHPDIPLDEQYDSDSSLTMAANKSLDLSRSLGDKCREKDNEVVSSDDEDQEGNARVDKENQSPEDTVKATTGSPCASSTPSQSDSTAKNGFQKIAPHERNLQETHRTRVAREIMDTERKYCTCLWTVLDHFAEPLRQMSILSVRDINTMFPPCLLRIYEHHCAFLQKLEDRLTNWRWQGVLGDVFARFIDDNETELLKLYQVYVNEFPSALHHIRKYFRQSSKFRKFLRKSQRHRVCEGLDLPSFLLTPIQRMPRYVLLLKQLLRHTDTEHPDHYYIESSLSKLGTFLTHLNDSIEYSMQVVSSDATPKPKRRQLPSLRSSAGSYDAMQFSSATRDSGIHSNGEDLLYGGSNGRAFQMSMHKGAPHVTNRHNGIDPPLSASNNSLSRSSHSLMSSMPYPSQPTCRDRTFNNYESMTLPIRGEKRRKAKFKRPPEMNNQYHSEYYHDQYMNYPGMVPPMQDDGFLRPQSANLNTRRMPRQRPLSLVERTDSFHSQSSERYGNIKDLEVSRESLQLDDQRMFLHPSVMSSRGTDYRSPATRKFLTSPLNSSIQSMPVVPNHVATKFGHHQSMPKIEPDYGIYGEDDDDPIDQSMYEPSVLERNRESLTRRAQKLGITPRSQSQTNITGNGSASPSQKQVTMALARSLTDQVPEPNAPRGLSSETPDPRPRSGSKNRQVAPAVANRPGQVRQNVWDESTEINESMINGSIVSTNEADRRKELKKKKKEKQKRLAEGFQFNGQPDGSIKEHKKKGLALKNSIRSIFTRKRKDVDSEKTGALEEGKIIEIGSSPEYGFGNDTEGPNEIHSQSSLRSKASANLNSPSKEQAPPTDTTIFINQVQLDPDFGTFEDENGDPCSAV